MAVTALEFRPGPVVGGDYTIEIGTAGSAVMGKPRRSCRGISRQVLPKCMCPKSRCSV
jgi:hypothetical protein